MSENKRYFFLQLPEDFFSSKRIKKLRKLAGGDTFTIIYLKLQLFSLNNSGLIEWSGLEETLAEELALEIDESPENIAVTLKYLLSCGLAEIKNEQDIHLPYVEKMTSSHTASTERSRRFRAKAKELPDCCESVALQRECNADATQDIRDKSRDIRDESIKERIPLKGDKKESEEDASLPRFRRPTLEDVTAYCEERGNGVDPQRFISYYDSVGWKVGKTPMKDWRAAVRTWEAKEKKKSGKVYDHGDIAYKAAKALAREVSKRLGVEFREPVLQEWAAEIEACSKEYGNSIEDMAGVMEFSQTDEFWSGIILDGYKFRAKYPQLVAAMQRSED